MGTSRDLTNNKDLLYELVRTSFKLRYNNSVLGFLWVVLKPLMTFGVLYLVFSRFRGEGLENYAVYLLLGVILYNFFTEGILLGMNSLLDKAHIILKVNFPRQIAVVSALCMSLINFGINILILIIFILFNPVDTNVIALVYFTFICFLIFLITISISFFSSIIAVRLRDLQNIFDVLLQIGFYATPIIFPISFVPTSLLGLSWLNPRQLVELNPLTVLIQAARSAIITGEVVSLTRILTIFVVFLIVLLLGNFFFQKQVRKVAEYF